MPFKQVTWINEDDLVSLNEEQVKQAFNKASPWDYTPAAYREMILYLFTHDLDSDRVYEVLEILQDKLGTSKFWDVIQHDDEVMQVVATYNKDRWLSVFIPEAEEEVFYEACIQCRDGMILDLTQALTAQERQELLDVIQQEEAKLGNPNKAIKIRKEFDKNGNPKIIEGRAAHLQQSLFRFPGDNRYYVLQGKIGEGGRGVVKESLIYYQIEQGILVQHKDKRVAIKIMRGREKVKALNEANYAKTLGQDKEAVHARLDDRPDKDYIKLTHAGDVDLEAYLKNNMLTLVDKLTLLTSIVKKIRYIHLADEKMRHYYIDLKPENVMMNNGDARFVDWGSVRSQIDASLPNTPLFDCAALKQASTKEAYALAGLCMLVLELPYHSAQSYEHLPLFDNKTKPNANPHEQPYDFSHLRHQEPALSPLIDMLEKFGSNDPKVVLQAVKDDREYKLLEAAMEKIINQLKKRKSTMQSLSESTTSFSSGSKTLLIKQSLFSHHTSSQGSGNIQIEQGVKRHRRNTQ